MALGSTNTKYSGNALGGYSSAVPPHLYCKTWKSALSPVWLVHTTALRWCALKKRAVYCVVLFFQRSATQWMPAARAQWNITVLYSIKFRTMRCTSFSTSTLCWSGLTAPCTSCCVAMQQLVWTRLHVDIRNLQCIQYYNPLSTVTRQKAELWTDNVLYKIKQYLVFIWNNLFLQRES